MHCKSKLCILYARIYGSSSVYATGTKNAGLQKVCIPQNKILGQVLFGRAHFLLPTILRQHPDNDKIYLSQHVRKYNILPVHCMS